MGASKMTLVNSRGHTLESPCERGVFGRICTTKDYDAWRRVAVDLRGALLTGRILPVDEALGDEKNKWLQDWVSMEIADDSLRYSIGWGLSLRQEDPDIDTDNGARFPSDPSVWMGEYSPTEIVTYTELTEDLVSYIKDGWRIYQRARAKKIVMITGPYLRGAEGRAEEEPPSWIKPVVTVGIIAGTIAFATWIYTSIRGAGRQPTK